MRCSKCQYIGFDNSDRCRNCGYEFSLAADADGFDLPIRTGDEPAGPLSDFPLSDADRAEPPAASAPPAERAAPPRRSGGAALSRSGSGELPLFGDRSRGEDAPLVSLPASPRAPVAVRKSTVAPRPAQRPPHNAHPEPALELYISDEPDVPPAVEPRVAAQAAPAAAPAADDRDIAPILPRLLAAVIDIGLLAAIDVVVLYFTLKLCALAFTDVLLIPLIPFMAFILFLNGGYVAAFTAAGGQTIGKMLTGIRVVTSEEGTRTDRVPVGAAALRALGYFLSAIPAGLGFLPVLVGAERRGLHDRLAHTRVVRA